MTPSEELRQGLTQQDMSLDHALSLVATVHSRGGQLRQVGDLLDQMALDAPHPITVEQLLTYAFTELAFQGDLVRYYDPNNSLIHRVLERRKGIPLSLACIVSELARRLDLPLFVVGLPGHVLLCEELEPSRWFDPFEAGAVMSRDDCRRLFSRFRPAEQFDDSMLAPIAVPAIVIRTLANLRVAYLRLGDVNRLIEVAEMRTTITESQSDRSELVGLLELGGRVDQAIAELETLSATSTDHEGHIERRLAHLRSRLN